MYRADYFSILYSRNLVQSPIVPGVYQRYTMSIKCFPEGCDIRKMNSNYSLYSVCDLFSIDMRDHNRRYVTSDNK